MEGVVHLKGDLHLLGDDVLIERTGMRDGHGVEVVTGGEAGRAGELSTGREGLGEGLIRIKRLALWASHSFMRTATSLVAGSGV